MANTVYGPYAKTTWTNGTTALNSTHMTNLETQASVSLNGFNPDLVGAYVLSGVVCTKDGSTANKLDIAAGRAYVQMTDGTVGLIVVAATSQTTSTPSTTYHLYLQPDGTFYWSTSNSPQTNSLALATVATDGSGNISSVTDARVLNTTLLSGMTGQGGTVYLPTAVGQQQTQNDQLAGAVFGGVTFAQAGGLTAGGDNNGAALFNGTTGYILFPTTGLPSGTSTITLECLFKIAANPGVAANLIEIGTQSANQAFYIGMNTSGGIYVGNASVNSTASAGVSTNVWHHAVATWDGSKMHIFLDGTEVGTGTSTTMTLTYGGANLGTIGALVGGASNFFGGTLDEVAVYSGNLSAARVTAHFNAVAAGGYLAAVQADAPLRLYRLGDPVSAAWAQDTIATTAATVLDAGGGFPAAIPSVGGQPSAGSFGVPVIVALVNGTLVTSTASQTILVWQPPADGLYRINGFVSLHNSTTSAIQFKWTYTDDNFAENSYFGVSGGGIGGTAGHPSLTDGNINFASGGTVGLYAPMPAVFVAKKSATITVFYQDPSGSPSDKVYVVIERLI